ncbi:UNVERIFIED_CONTAM: hypothetical protein PYX00_003030 [Menopon gallinae]|uniref:Phosphatidylinositol-specific phospholipase C X domain-containing protein n=1 Tax=Menopon gallinae TaxID=328185 RepID=A0AAW2I067_9NEOP
MKKTPPSIEDPLKPSEKLFIQTNNFETGSIRQNINLENWMSQLPDPLIRTPIIHLAIPGSHNSFSYSLSQSSGVSPDSPEIVQQLGKWLKPITNRIVYNWSMGQDENVTKQLTSGIRYFDIRLVCRNGEIHISHGLFGGLITNFLQEINNFLNNHPREVIILDFQHFYKFSQQNHGALTNVLEQIFGSKMCRRRIMMRDISLDYMWRNNHQVIAIYRNSFVNYNDLCWPSGSWITAWPNKISVNELLSYLDKGIATRRQDVGFVSQGILTPTTKYVVVHIASNLKKLALKSNEKLSQWLETKSIGSNGVNVVICDFVETYAFCEKVVSLNYKSLKNPNEIKALNQEVVSN